MRRAAANAVRIALLLALSACATPGGSGGQDLTLGAPGQHIEASVYESASLTPSPTLVVVLHGDAPILRPSYQNEFAADVTRSLPNLIAAGLLRPGYIDPFGRRSDPQTGPATGNNYTLAVTAQVAAAVEALKARYHPARTILVGHSGGAAVAANMLEAVPRIADAAVLASCPCDLAAWRTKMERFGARNSHKDSLSPLEGVARLPRDIPIAIMVGAKDNTVGVDNSRTFYEAAKAAGANVTLEVVPKAGHMMMSAPAAVAAVRRLAEPAKATVQP